MAKNQLFRITPDRNIVLKLLSFYGIEGFEDNRYFTKKDLESLHTIEKINEIKDELNNYYIPCKSKVYLTNITDKKTITILRQFLKTHNYTLMSKEKYIQGIKHIIYKIIPMDIHINTHSPKKSSVIIHFD
jgi:hypothetical protein